MLAPGAGSAAMSPNAVFASMIAAAARQQSFRATGIQSGCACDDGARITQVTDVKPNEGDQRITYTSNGQTGHVTVLVKGGRAYVYGDAFALTNYMGYKPDAAAAYSERWILIPSTNPDFKAVSTDVTLASSVSDLYVPQPLRLTPGKTLNGKAVIGVTGTRAATAKSAAATVFLYARAMGIPLPVEQDVAEGKYSARVTFSRWNEQLIIVTPNNATPISSTGLE